MKLNGKTRLETRHWLAIAVLIRLIASFTRVNWHYPDEWYQTIEFTRLLSGKFAIYTHEMALHLRNLSWPVLLLFPQWVAQGLSPHWTQFRLICAQIFAGLLDLAALWAFARLSRGWSRTWRAMGFALLIFPWFRVQDSVSLGAEHISDCLIWLSLLLLETEDLSQKWRRPAMFAAGLLAVGIFAVKYPSALVSLGFGLAVLVRSIRDRRPSDVVLFGLGAVLGLGVFGAADWHFYGRPWESFWMYLQYNVLTSEGVAHFGRQSAMEYFDFLRSRWLHVLLPFGIALVTFGSLALARGIRRIEPWAWAFVFYFAGHMMIAHREARFMFPAETLLLWGALKYLASTRPNWRPTRAVAIVLGISWLLNAPLFLKALIGEMGTLNSTYLEVDQHLAENPGTCAVITQRLLPSFLIPGETAPEPVFGTFHAERRRPTFPQAETATLAWYGDAPRCSPSQGMLLHVDRPDVAWIEAGCKLERSGVLEVLPSLLWFPFLRRGWVSGPWYACPATTLDHFKKQISEHPFIGKLAHFSALPPLGTTADSLEAFRDQYAPPIVCKENCP